jgi:putative membrane protein
MGKFTNNSRNLAIKLKHLVTEKEFAFFNYAIPLYCTITKKPFARRICTRETKALLLPMDPKKHVPNQVASAIIKNVYRLNKEGQINPSNW